MIAGLLLFAAQPAVATDSAIPALLLALPAQPTAHEVRAAEALDAYVDCLKSKSASPPLERRVADEQARSASRQCQAPRAAMVEAFIPLVPAILETSQAKREEAESGAAAIDSAFARSLTLKPLRIVPSQPE